MIHVASELCAEPKASQPHFLFPNLSPEEWQLKQPC